MANINAGQFQYQKQTQKQTLRLSHIQIQALNILAMGSDDLRTLIYNAVNENPALEITRDVTSSVGSASSVTRRSGSSDSADVYQKALEATEDYTETLQHHLIHQLNSMNLSSDEYELSEKLIYNLDKNGFYGTMLAPESLLNKQRPAQNKEMLARCMDRIQRMDPVGTCCKTPEESLYIQAKIDSDCSPLVLFVLDGHIEMLNPPEPLKIYDKLISYQEEWHKKKFAGEILLDKLDFDEYDVEEALNYILKLNVHPAQGYTKDTAADYEIPDIVLKIEKKEGYIPYNDYSKGLVAGNEKYHFQVKYASGELPEVKLVPEFAIDKENYQKAMEFLNTLAFRESTIVLQGCAIVNAQKEFFLSGKNLQVLTRKSIAAELNVHESTVSRMSSRKACKYFQTEWGLLPASYFFTSGVQGASDGQKVSSEVIKQKILTILEEKKSEGIAVSDQMLVQILGRQGIKIARRTVAKYRSQAGIANSYQRHNP